MESQPQNPEFRINPENFHACTLSDLNEMLVFRDGSNKMHVRIANREDPDQTAS